MKTPTAPEKRKAMATIAGLISVRVRNNVRLEVVLEELCDAKSARSSLNPDRAYCLCAVSEARRWASFKRAFVRSVERRD